MSLNKINKKYVYQQLIFPHDIKEIKTRAINLVQLEKSIIK